jgi:glycosyltransferase
VSGVNADTLNPHECGTPNYQFRWISEPDQGLYDALNKGLRMVTGDLIGILHTDDVWEEGILARVAEAFSREVSLPRLRGGRRTEDREDGDREASLECGSLLPPSGASGLPDGGNHSSTSGVDDPPAASHGIPRAEASFSTPGASVDAVYSDLVYVDAEDITKVRRYWKSGTYNPKKFYNGWMPPHTTLFVRKELAQRVGEYRLDLGSAADYEWMLRTCLVHKARLAYIPEVLVRMRVGGASNASVKGRLKAHGADQKAWELNGLKPKPWTLKMKVMRKLPQWVRAFGADGG